MAIFKPKYFAKTLDSFAKQVLPPSMYKRWGIGGLDKMDQRILEFIDEFRYDCGVPLTANDWSWNGNFSQRGARDVKQYGTYEKMAASRSDHITGRAIDLISSKLSGHELRLVFIKHKDKYFKKYGINFIEVGEIKSSSSPTGKKGMSWFHASVNIDQGQGVQYWSPVRGYVTEQEVIEEKL